VPRVRLATKAGISYKGITVFDEVLVDFGRRIAGKLNLRGAANIQCVVSGGKPSYFEVNPRFSGGLPLTLASGVNGPWWVLRLLRGEKAPEELLPFERTLMLRYWSETFRQGDELAGFEEGGTG